VHLREGNRGGERCGAEDYAEEESSHGLLILLNEIRRYLRGKVPVGFGDQVRLVYEAWMARRCWM
jgi:hypothetical protein